MWSHECSPVRMTVANAKSGDVAVTILLSSSCQTCLHVVFIVGYSCSYQVHRIRSFFKVLELADVARIHSVCFCQAATSSDRSADAPPPVAKLGVFPN